MRVGDSLEIPYVLPGPLPQGSYPVLIQGYQAQNDARLRIALVHRAMGLPDETLAQAEQPVAMGPDGGYATQLALTLQAGAVQATCGDRLVLVLTVLSGSSDFLEIQAVLTIP